MSRAHRVDRCALKRASPTEGRGLTSLRTAVAVRPPQARRRAGGHYPPRHPFGDRSRGPREMPFLLRRRAVASSGEPAGDVLRERGAPSGERRGPLCPAALTPKEWPISLVVQSEKHVEHGSRKTVRRAARRRYIVVVDASSDGVRERRARSVLPERPTSAHESGREGAPAAFGRARQRRPIGRGVWGRLAASS